MKTADAVINDPEFEKQLTEEAKAEYLASQATKPDDFVFDLDFPPGLVGEVARYILKSSRMPVKSFAIAGALTAVSYLNMNRFYVKPSDTPLNLYQSLVGGTGKGKEDPRKAIKRICDAAGNTFGLCESMASGPALLRTLEMTKEVLLMTDEFGIFMQVANSDRGSTHLKELVKELLILFPLGRSFFSGKRYADGKQNIGRIDNPYVSVIGTTTPEELIDGITMKAVDNGLLNRFLFVQASEAGAINRTPDFSIPPSLITELHNIGMSRGGGIAYCDGAHDMLVRLVEELKPTGKFENLWSRAEEQMIRIAGLLAIGEGMTITHEYVAWAFQYVNLAISSFETYLDQNLSETPFAKDATRALKYIANAKNYAGDLQFRRHLSKGLMPLGKLTKLLKQDTTTVSKIVSYLVQTKQVRALDTEGSQAYFVGELREN